MGVSSSGRVHTTKSMNGMKQVHGKHDIILVKSSRISTFKEVQFIQGSSLFTTSIRIGSGERLMRKSLTVLVEWR